MSEDRKSSELLQRLKQNLHEQDADRMIWLAQRAGVHIVPNERVNRVSGQYVISNYDRAQFAECIGDIDLDRQRALACEIARKLLEDGLIKIETLHDTGIADTVTRMSVQVIKPAVKRMSWTGEMTISKRLLEPTMINDNRDAAKQQTYEITGISSDIMRGAEQPPQQTWQEEIFMAGTHNGGGKATATKPPQPQVAQPGTTAKPDGLIYDCGYEPLLPGPYVAHDGAGGYDYFDAPPAPATPDAVPDTPDTNKPAADVVADSAPRGDDDSYLVSEPTTVYRAHRQWQPQTHDIWAEAERQNAAKQTAERQQARSAQRGGAGAATGETVDAIDPMNTPGQ